MNTRIILILREQVQIVNQEWKCTNKGREYGTIALGLNVKGF